VRPTAAGVCGSDLKVLSVTGMSPLLTAYSPARRSVLGHEITGVVEATGPGVTRVREGDAVLVEPTLRCAHKGLPDCARCAAGEGHVCERLDLAGDLCVGQGIGFSDVLGGGWSEGLLAHESMLVAADGIAADRAVLAEPASVALHAALRWDRTGDTVVVIGPGTVGLLVTAALRMLHPDLDITVVCAGEFGAGRAMAAGATRTAQQPSATVLAEVAAVLGARLLKPRLGSLPVLDTGVDAVFDCVAHGDTIDLGLRLLRPRGSYVMVGTAAKEEIDWSLLWWRELTLLGTIVYGEEPRLQGRRTFEQVADWLRDPSYRVDGLVTHRFPLERYPEALMTAKAGPAAGAVKVVLAP
jgi:threonine dehydrogenase-like Zn-dependent dehydrogenase